jgi:type I restriction enzyme S subunit
LFQVVNGGTPSADADNWGGGVAWATPVDLGRHHGKAIAETARTLTPRGLLTGSAAVPAGSLVVSTRAPIGYVAQAVVDLAFNQECRGLVPEERVDPRYYRYAFVSLIDSLQSLGQGSTFVELSSEALAAVLIPSPPPEQQRAIANFLDTEIVRIDTLVAKKRRLAVQADVRWRSQVVKELQLAGRSSTGPTPWIEDPLPDRWELRPLKRLITRSWGGDWGLDPGGAAWELPCVRAADFDFANLVAQVGVRRSFDAITLASRVLQPGDFVVEKSGGGEGVPVGRVVAWRGEGAAVPTNFAGGMRPSGDVDATFALLAFRVAYEIGLPWRSIKQTTGLQNLDLGHYLTHQLPVPPLEDQRAIARLLMRELERVRSLQSRMEQQIALLQEHRQALITAAVTGELEVPGVAA